MKLGLPTFATARKTAPAPRLQRVQMTMIGGVRQLKIFDAIVFLVFVDVVNMFFGGQFSAEMLGHNEPMLQDVLPAVPDKNVPLRVDMTPTSPRGIIFACQYSSFDHAERDAFFGAVSTIGLDFSLHDIEGIAAGLACDRDAWLSFRMKNFQVQTPAAFGASARDVSSNGLKYFSAVTLDRPYRFKFFNFDKSQKLDSVFDGSGKISEMWGSSVHDAFGHVFPSNFVVFSIVPNIKGTTRWHTQICVA